MIIVLKQLSLDIGNKLTICGLSEQGLFEHSLMNRRNLEPKTFSEIVAISRCVAFLRVCDAY